MNARRRLGTAQGWFGPSLRLVFPLLLLLLLWPATAVHSTPGDAGPAASMSLYLPLVFKSVPPPAAPVLSDISNPDGDGNYTVQWSAVSGATSYLLQEDDHAGFTSPTEIGPTVATSASITGKAKGTYYYRAQAANAGGSSAWSATKSVVVTKEPTGPEPGYYTGTPNVEFDVTADGRVCNFQFSVPFNGGTCHMGMLTCAAIVDGKFGWTETDPWLGAYDNKISGTFDSRTHVRGDYSIHFCGSTLIFSASKGTWEASK